MSIRFSFWVSKCVHGDIFIIFIFDHKSTSHSLCVGDTPLSFSQKFGTNAREVISFTRPCIPSIIMRIGFSWLRKVSCILLDTEVNAFNSTSSQTSFTHPCQASPLYMILSVFGIFLNASSSLLKIENTTLRFEVLYWRCFVFLE